MIWCTCGAGCLPGDEADSVELFREAECVIFLNVHAQSL
ncbi:hypothetical protein DESPIGER_0501 [Desulfovibrio piger]|uniref:Uncharacterized protein n=1 Tax=Desulfovibrio piger TaxID=901 RepID=A0A1K1LCH2_9BACT|nr:hypothetical protein DESPIGER_0501 [Desulfovibrio piger]